MIVPKSMTPEKLRDIADWLDLYDRLAESYIRFIESIGRTPASANVEATIETVRGEAVQNDLRAWAASLEAQQERKRRNCENCGCPGCCEEEV